ncbi:anti-sigma factor [Salinibacterium sp. SWN248]|uniref:anti-sigma factor n=1 Tax=Salinibacterium sp. SWN248 TaxID=2792056 RepID=UPI0018CF9596|nr:anti-sigma factor [Salinibacterium sp. SWN248]MBH0025295.1 anti-sigma factor [Salinibacterium sp. SWN248]
MRHVDPEILALLALGEQVALPEDSVHVSECDQCRREIEVLSRAAMVGRSTFDAGELLQPPSRVWERISDELALTAEDASATSAPAIGDADDRVPSDELAQKRVERVDVAVDESTATIIAESGTVHSLAERRRRPWIGIVAAAAAVALVASAGTALWSTFRPAEQPTILASATLAAFPDWPDSTGEAKLEQLPDGTRVIDVNFDAPATDGGYREVWLITTDATALVSLGIVEGTSGQFTVPDGLDISSYDLVDISEEQFDGNPAHSGDSIVRGQLSSDA